MHPVCTYWLIYLRFNYVISRRHETNSPRPALHMCCYSSQPLNTKAERQYALNKQLPDLKMTKRVERLLACPYNLHQFKVFFILWRVTLSLSGVTYSCNMCALLCLLHFYCGVKLNCISTLRVRLHVTLCAMSQYSALWWCSNHARRSTCDLQLRHQRQASPI